MILKKTYKFKIVPKTNVKDICFWGCEMWNNPRLDVVVEAISGSTANVNKDKAIEGYYSDWHKPALIITDILAINDQSYINVGAETVGQWIANNSFIYDYCRKNGVPVIAFCTHDATRFTTVSLTPNLAYQNNVPYIDISKKIIVSPPLENIKNSTDNLHLSNYGNTYYFEELERILDGNSPQLG